MSGVGDVAGAAVGRGEDRSASQAQPGRLDRRGEARIEIGVGVEALGLRGFKLPPHAEVERERAGGLPILLQERGVIVLADRIVRVEDVGAGGGRPQQKRRRAEASGGAGGVRIRALGEAAIEIERTVADAAEIEGGETLVVAELQRVTR